MRPRLLEVAMNRLVKTLGLCIAASLVAGAGAAVADVTFINNTGAPATDFHYDVQVIRGTFTPPNSNPWGAGSAVDDGVDIHVSYSGSAIAVGGKFVLLGIKFSELSLGTSKIYSNFTWTPGGQTATAVPEPAGWVLMTLGVGAIGLTARRRRAGATSAVA
jgi:hypothetical protein